MNDIIFYPNENSNLELIKEYVTEPVKASSTVSEWFKKAPRFQNHEKEMVVDLDSGYHNLTVRHCMPFLDSMTAGYFLTTWTDIYVKREGDDVLISYQDSDKVQKFGYGLVQYQKYFSSNIPTLAGHDKFLYAWSTYWRIKTPEGVSCLFTSPLNHTDLPFTTLSGIIDTDNWSGSDVLNFAFKKDFEGVIPKGTPYIQIIPFRREEWNLTISNDSYPSINEERELVIKKRYEKESGYYRDNLWEKKKY